MTTAILAQIPLEVIGDGQPAAQVAQVALEVANVSDPTAQLAQVAVETAANANPTLQLGQFVVEVLSSTTNAAFDFETAFFGYPPAGAVVERYEWLSDVQQAQSGAQVRVALREQPRLASIEFDVIEADNALRLDLLISGWQAAFYYLPAWQDRATLTGTVSAGATVISVDTTNRAYIAGGFVAIYRSPELYEVAEILNVNPASITLAGGGLVSTWGAGDTIAPVRKAKLSPTASASRFTGGTLQARLAFELEDPVAITPLEWGAGAGVGGPWTVDGFALFARRPNWSDDPRVDYARRLRILDNGVGKVFRQDKSARGWITRTHLHTLTSKAEIAEFLQWVAARRGRAVSFLAPVWEQAIEVTQSNTSGATTLTIKSRQLAELWPVLNGRRYLALRHAGGWIVRRITAIAAAGSEEILTLNAAIGIAGTVSTWLDACLAEPAHLAADAVELRYFSDSVADVTIAHEQVIA